MPYREEKQERLIALLRRVNEKKPHPNAAVTYREVPLLREMESICEEELASSQGDLEVLRDSAQIFSYLADAYEGLGRFAISAELYDKYFAVARALWQDFGVALPECKDVFYRALRTKNIYADDDCAAFRAAAEEILSPAVAGEVYTSVLSHRRSLRHDPVECTEAYLAVIDEVEAELARLFPESKRGICYEIWHMKKDLLAARGIHWHTPKELNPHVHFD